MYVVYYICSVEVTRKTLFNVLGKKRKKSCQNVDGNLSLMG